MRYLSICAGIEAASVAWQELGWTKAGFSEIDPFPRAVLAERFGAQPVEWDHRFSAQSNFTPLFGDFTQIEEHHVGPIDLLVGGTPCQSFSIAGLRGGLGDDRGNLALEFLRLAQRTRPRWLVWENVPGVLSSHKGRDFGSILGGMVELGYGYAYRVLDAQHFGVPQRRKRVFLVGYLGDWRPPAAVLFERHSLSGHPAPSREQRQETSGSTGDGLARCITTGESKRQDWETCNFVAQPLAFDTTQITSASNYSNPKPGDPCHPLAAGAHAPAIAFDLRNGTESEVTMALQSGGMGDERGICPNAIPHVLAFPTEMSGTQYASTEGLSPALSVKHTTSVATEMAVRRLTPRECERLQGFPDDWTLVPYRSGMAKDGPRYKALGNSMAVPVMRWLGERISMVEALL